MNNKQLFLQHLNTVLNNESLLNQALLDFLQVDVPDEINAGLERHEDYINALKTTYAADYIKDAKNMACLAAVYVHALGETYEEVKGKTDFQTLKNELDEYAKQLTPTTEIEFFEQLKQNVTKGLAKPATTVEQAKDRTPQPATNENNDSQASAWPRFFVAAAGATAVAAVAAYAYSKMRNS